MFDVHQTIFDSIKNALLNNVGSPLTKELIGGILTAVNVKIVNMEKTLISPADANIPNVPVPAGPITDKG